MTTTPDFPHIIVPRRDRGVVRGSLHILALDARTGRLVDERGPFHPNRIVDAGLNSWLRDCLDGSAAGALSHLAVGTDGTAAAAGDTSLVSEVHRDAFTTETTNDKQKIFRLTVGSGTANGNDLKEAGLFNDATAGTMFARTTYSAITKTSDIAVQYNWQVDLSYVA